MRERRVKRVRAANSVGQWHSEKRNGRARADMDVGARGMQPSRASRLSRPRAHAVHAWEKAGRRNGRHGWATGQANPGRERGERLGQILMLG